MNHTSELALDILKKDLAGVAAYGAKQVAYVSGKFFTDFTARAIGAVLVGGMPDLRRRHAESLAAGGVIEGDVRFVAGSEGATQNLDVIFEDGETLHLEWTDTEDDEASKTEINLSNSRDSITPSLRSARDEMLRGATLNDMMPLAREFARNLTEDQQVGGADIHGSPGSGYSFSKGWSHWNGSRIDLVQRLASLLDLSLGKKEVDFESRPHLEMATNGTLVAGFGSAAALAFETYVIGSMPEITEIISLAGELSLGNGTSLSYGDYDRHFTIASTSERDILVHNNIDRNEPSVFMMALNWSKGEIASVDMHISQAWYRNFEERYEQCLSDVATLESFDDLIEHSSENLYRPNEDQLIAEILTDRSCRGLAYSYDMTTGGLTLGEAAFHTTFMAYVEHMISQDLTGLRNLRAAKKTGGMQITYHDGETSGLQDQTTLSPLEHLARLNLANAC
ncbi:hypothetical protein G6L37_00890 [Agrobacterium rubi]|nr:hypothetical protein [Agrobacterium rubi]NTF23947.1 hypothetical protein [Agrobacterium rubi]